ncbi:MAG TPA: TIGR03663 family protein, partial [Methanosarcina vacuolata]|nr:TIGR03663 family protein [Methanosarcina vacuolata]
MQRGRDYNTKNSPELSEKKYKILGFLIIFFALSIRLLDLGERVFHHDESVHASFTLRLLETGQYRYNPAYHGPFLFHSTAVVFHFLGINDTTARLIPVFFGIAAILLLFLLKKELGERGVLWSAFLLSF